MWNLALGTYLFGLSRQQSNMVDVQGSLAGKGRRQVEFKVC